MHFRYVVFGLVPQVHIAAHVELDNGLQMGGTTVRSRHIVQNDRVMVDRYLGIPFADAPIGDLRFRPPQEYTGRWEGVHEFTIEPSDCYTGKVGTAEDCLYLNVFRPSGTIATDSLPVMVWIFGGGFVNGRIGGTDGTELAARENVILVVPAYRLGAFGFLASAATFAESNTTGNWGILDQRMALQWIQRNIKAFGGDKNQVTLFGHSAGAMSVATHLTSNPSWGLFHRAILSSPSASSPYFFRPLEDSYQFADWVARTGGCVDSNDLACLRRIPASQLLVRDGHRDSSPPPWASRLFPFMSYGITIDGTVLDANPLERARLGMVADVPVMIGVVQDEGSIFAMTLDSFVRPKVKGDIKEEDLANITSHLLSNHDGFATKFLKEEFHLYRAFTGPFQPLPVNKVEPAVALDSNRPLSELETQFKRIASLDVANLSMDEILAAMPILSAPPTPSSPTPYDKAPLLLFKDALRDSIFVCSSLAFAEAVAVHNQNRVWFYDFDLDVYHGTMFHLYETRLANDKGSHATVAELGAYHGSELAFIWNDFPEQLALPLELQGTSTFTAPQFCPADSFKRRAANQIGCLWTSFAKCGSPQCASTCDGVGEWETLPRVMHMEKHGQFSLTTVATDERSPVGAILPSAQQCKKWLHRDIPFVRLATEEIPLITFAKQSTLMGANCFLLTLSGIFFLLA